MPVVPYLVDIEDSPSDLGDDIFEHRFRETRALPDENETYQPFAGTAESHALQWVGYISTHHRGSCGIDPVKR